MGAGDGSRVEPKSVLRDKLLHGLVGCQRPSYERSSGKGFEVMHVTTPYICAWLSDMHGPKTYGFDDDYFTLR